MRNHSPRSNAGDVQDWSQLKIVCSLPRGGSGLPSMSLLLMRQRGRVPDVTWVETWESSVPLGDPHDVGAVYEWLMEALGDRLRP